MSPILNALTFLVVCHGVFGWLGVIERDPSATLTDGQCHTTVYDLGTFQKGETKRLNDQCAIATCQDNGNIRLSGCAPIQSRYPCYVMPGILSKPFPECCHEIKCVDDKNSKENVAENVI